MYADRRVLLPRVREVERLLEDLDQGRPLDPEPGPDARRALLDLGRRGCLLPVEKQPGASRVEVDGVFPHLDVHPLLRAAGLRPVSPGHGADVVLVVSSGELARERLDHLVRRSASHLVVRLVDGGAVLGPFVVPGRTACLRCLDAHLSVGDPEHVAVTTRYLRARRPEHHDAALTTLVAGWAVRDLAAYTAGREPSTWSRTWRLGAEPTQMSEERWLRHPGCGCSWNAGPPACGTMGG